MRILILNGVNLNLLGKREQSIYGNTSFEAYLSKLKNRYRTIQIDYIQSNDESVLVHHIQEADTTYNGIVLNAGAFTHTSIAICDAIRSICIPVIEIHISNIFAREIYRRKSCLSEVCKGSICGLGLDGYRLAIESFIPLV
ncbi:MAG: 3-dehydroquinate dehydratase [Bacteroidales bacterium]|jgi:3-dehydroquinate dehydratase-2|nr:3-dehydroquinate dehydratase [Bacteroidales bacterium]